MGVLATIAQIVAQVAGLMPSAVSVEQNVVTAWSTLKPLIGGQVMPPDPTPQQLADLDATIHTLALEAHTAWHRGDGPAADATGQP